MSTYFVNFTLLQHAAANRPDQMVSHVMLTVNVVAIATSTARHVMTASPVSTTIQHVKNVTVIRLV